MTGSAGTNLSKWLEDNFSGLCGLGSTGNRPALLWQKYPAQASASCNLLPACCAECCAVKVCGARFKRKRQVWRCNIPTCQDNGAKLSILIPIKQQGRYMGVKASRACEMNHPEDTCQQYGFFNIKARIIKAQICCSPWLTHHAHRTRFDSRCSLHDRSRVVGF